MKIGLVGKPSSGKSTFFKAITLAEVDIAPYPFTTIAKNEGVGFVKIDCVDKEFNVNCQPKHGYCLANNRFVPVELVDVAGLIPGSHKGLGRGNQFLDDLRQADALIHIVDISGSTNEKGEQVEALSYDPANDVKFLEHELDMWYLRLITKGWEQFARKTSQEKQDLNKALARHLSGLGVNEGSVENLIKKLELSADLTKWNEEILMKIAVELRKLTKPMIIACNKIDVRGAEENFSRLKKEFPETILIECSAESELALKEAAKHKLIDYIPGDKNFKILNNDKLNEKQKNALNFIRNNVLEKHGTAGVQEVLDKAVFELLKCVTVFPVENENKLTDSENRILPDSHLMPSQSTALDLAFKVHTDIGNKFNCAIDVRTRKRLSKDYILKNRDVVKVMVNTS